MKCNTEWGLRLNLSYKQAELKFDKTAKKWVPTEQSYRDTEDYKNKKFLGLTFERIEQYWD